MNIMEKAKTEQLEVDNPAFTAIDEKVKDEKNATKL